MHQTSQVLDDLAADGASSPFDASGARERPVAGWRGLLSRRALRRGFWRLFLRWRFLLFQRHRHDRLVLEWVAGQPILVLPQVLNPVLFRTGQFLAEEILRGTTNEYSSLCHAERVERPTWPAQAPVSTRQRPYERVPPVEASRLRMYRETLRLALRPRMRSARQRTQLLLARMRGRPATKGLLVPLARGASVMRRAARPLIPHVAPPGHGPGSSCGREFIAVQTRPERSRRKGAERLGTTQKGRALIPLGSTVLDMGCGSGIAAIFAARWADRVVAVDINPAAVRCTRINALLNGVEERVEVLQGDLFEPVQGRRFDVVLFNPPYYQGQPRTNLERALWSTDLKERFAAGLSDHLAPGGYALLVLSTDGDQAGWLQVLRSNGFTCQAVASRDLISEVLTIYQVRNRRNRVPLEERGS